MLQRQRENESGMVGNFVEIASREAEGHLVARKILSIRSVGKRHMYDLEIRHPSHNFFIFNGIITSNSHAMAYSAITAAEFWLKFKFPTEYMTSLLRNTGNNEKKAGSENVLIDYIKYCRRKRMIMLNPTINTKIPTFDIIEDNKIRFGLDHIKMVANNAQRICDLAPYTDFEDFYNRINRTKVNKRVVANLIASGAFDEFGKRICIKAQVEKLQKSNSQLSAEDAEKAVDAAHINTGACRNAIAFEYYRLRKDKKEALPKEENSEHWWDKEKEIMGICLSRPPAFYTFKDIVDKNKWTRISDAPFKNDAYVFGRIEKATPKTSKSGNQMLVVELTDDVDTMNFYVFQNSRNQYQKELKVGYVAAIPLKKFDDSSTRYYDLRRSSTIVQKKASTQ
jgi:DNA polymerase III alpha subunit